MLIKMEDFDKLIKNKEIHEKRKIKGIRTDCIYNFDYGVELEYEIKKGSFFLIGGPTGYESFVLEDALKDKEQLMRLFIYGWCACGGTSGVWDKLYIKGNEMRKVFIQEGLINDKINYDEIDPKIRTFIKQINKCKIVKQTTVSCEGHNEQKHRYPFVGIELINKELRNKFIIMLTETFAFQLSAEENVVFIASTLESTVERRRKDMLEIVPKVLLSLELKELNQRKCF